MSKFVRLPEPTSIKAASEKDSLVSEPQLRGYIHQLIRVLGINFSNLEQESSSGSTTVVIASSSSSITINNNSYQWNGDTDSAGITFTLPSGQQGQTFKLVNVGTSGNLLTITPDGSELLIGVNSSFTLSDGEALVISYDATYGWY